MYGSRTKNSTTGTGTGALTLSSVVGFATINSVFGNDTDHNTGIPFQYFIVSQDGSQWESGIGRLTTSSSMTRLAIEANSSGTLVALNFSAGTKFVTATPVGRGVLSGLPTVYTGATLRMLPTMLPLGSVTTLAVSANLLYYTPFYVGVADQVDAVLYYVSAGAAGNSLAGIFTMDPTTGGPGRRLTIGSTAAVAAGFNARTFTARTLPPGWYFLGVNFSGTPTVTAVAGAAGSMGGYFSPLGASAANVPVMGFTEPLAHPGPLPAAAGVLTAITTAPALGLRVT